MRVREDGDERAESQSITLVSTRTIDRMPLPSGGFREQSGGPAHYIGDALHRLGRPFSLLTGVLAEVVVVPTSAGEEYIIPALPRIPLPARLDTAAVIYSPIMQEIDAVDIPAISGLLVVDLQGFVREPDTRTGESHHQFDVARLLDRADVVKASPVELSRLNAESRELLSARVLLITLGEEGALLEEHGRRSHVPSRRVMTTDTIGAGDNFLAAYVHCVLSEMTPLQATERAARFTEEVLSERRR